MLAMHPVWRNSWLYLIICSLVLAVSSIVYARDSSCSHLLQSRVKILEYETPLQGDERLFIYLSRGKRENSLCGPVSLANGIAKITEQDPQSVLNHVLHTLQKQTRRRWFDLDRRGLEGVQFKRLIETNISEVTPSLSLEIQGMWKWGPGVSDVSAKSLSLADSSHRFVLAFLSTYSLWVRRNPENLPPNWNRQTEEIVWKELEANVSPVSRNISRGHYVLIDKFRETSPRAAEIQYFDPEIAKPVTAQLRPFSVKRSGYQTFAFPLEDVKFSKYLTPSGNEGIMVGGRVTLLSSIYIVGPE